MSYVAYFLYSQANRDLCQVKSPVTCGIASLGFDHMELLGIQVFTLATLFKNFLCSFRKYYTILHVMFVISNYLLIPLDKLYNERTRGYGSSFFGLNETRNFQAET